MDNKRKAKIIWDNKKEWVYLKKDLYRKIMQSSTIPFESQDRVQKYKKGLWETPKVFVDGYAYNDGTWVIYNTCRVKKGKFRYKLACMSKQDVIKYLYGYMFFLKQVGVNNFLEMGYFSTCFIIYKLAIPQKVWSRNIKNVLKVEELAKNVLRSPDGPRCDWTDSRKYCIDPKLKRGKSKGQVIGLQRKKDKEVTWNRIKELYDSSLTNPENLLNMANNGLHISESTLNRFKRALKFGVSNGSMV